MLAAKPTPTGSDHHAALLRWRRQRRRLQSNLQHTACRALEELSDSELEQHLDQLCRDLMDYLSICHSKVYARYCPPLHSCGPARRGEQDSLLQDIWLHLGRTTDLALRFNRRCETTPGAALQRKLRTELGRLNKSLSLRFVLEEQLLELGAGCPLPEE